MPTILQLRRGTTAENAAYTGSVGELTVDTTLNKVILHDGSTAGGTTVGNLQGNIQIGKTAAGEIDTSSGNLTIDSAGGTITLDDHVIISGNLTVSGTETKVNSTTLEVGDNIVELNAGTNDGGLYVKETSGGAATGSLLYDVSANRWIAGTKGSEVTLPTISSTDTLTNKTINASQLSGTIADARLSSAVLTTSNSDAPATTTSSSDADFILVDDGGTMKKITPANLGISANQDYGLITSSTASSQDYGAIT